MLCQGPLGQNFFFTGRKKQTFFLFWTWKIGNIFFLKNFSFSTPGSDYLYIVSFKSIYYLSGLYDITRFGVVYV